MKIGYIIFFIGFFIFLIQDIKTQGLNRYHLCIYLVLSFMSTFFDNHYADGEILISIGLSILLCYVLRKIKLIAIGDVCFIVASSLILSPIQIILFIFSSLFFAFVFAAIQYINKKKLKAVAFLPFAAPYVLFLCISISILI